MASSRIPQVILRLIVVTTLVATSLTGAFVSTAGAADPSDHQVIGVVGCSNTRDHAGGYETVSVEDKLWPSDSIKRYGGGSLRAWVNNKNDKYFKIFDTALAEHGADAVWLQMCIRTEDSSETGMTEDQQGWLLELISRIHERDATLPIYISPLNFYTEEDCPAVGAYGQPNSVELADWAVEQGLALRGPDTGPLDHSLLIGDLCHMNTEGALLVGQQLVDFFDNVPPEVAITAPQPDSTVSGEVTIRADVTDDYGLAQVEFYVDDVLLATDLEAPYEATWDTVAGYDAAHTLRVVAIDNVTKTGERTITVTVDNGNVNTPPVALIADDGDDTLTTAVGASLVLDGSGSFDADGSIVAHDWDFGDGETAHGSDVVSHAYTAEGTYLASLTVIDDGGLAATDTVSVIVAATDPPAVTITSPADLDTVSGTVTITADATDDVGVGYVTFTVDGALLATDFDAPYEAVWDSTLDYDGSHVLTARAVDGAGLSAEDQVTVTSDNGNVNTAPIAVIADDGAGGLGGIVNVPVTFDGTGSSDADGEILQYRWDFGDGATELGATVEHGYAAAGNYTATLTVTDDGGLIGTATVDVTVAADEPPFIEIGSPTPGPVAGVVAVEATASDDAGVVSVEFLVDGASLAVVTQPPYTTDWDSTGVYDGTHVIAAVATDTIGQTAEQSVTVEVANGNANTPPTAVIAADNGVIETSSGVLVTLDGSASSDAEGSIADYAWDFGDGTAGSGATVEHVYTTAGTYEASLTVTDDGGLNGSATVTVIVVEGGAVTVFADSFENGEWNGLWTQDIQNDWSITDKLATDGAHSAMVQGPSGGAALTTVPIDLAGRTTASISFTWQLRPRASAGDTLELESSSDGGATWTQLAVLAAGVDSLGDWHDVNVSVTGTTALQLRLAATIAGGRVAALVDNVVVTAGDTPAAPAGGGVAAVRTGSQVAV